MAGIQADKVYTPLLCLVGILGNSVSLGVFCVDSNYRQQSSSYYLSSLALSDTIFLINLFALWLESNYGGIIALNFICPLVMYLGQVTCFVSVYLTVGFTLERYIATNFPFSRLRLCTTSKAKRYIFCVVATALVLFSYAWHIAEVVEIKNPAVLLNGTFNFDSYSQENISVCSVPDQYFKVSEIANYIDSGVTLIIPFVLIICFNVGTVMSLKHTSKQRSILVSSHRISSAQLEMNPSSLIAKVVSRLRKHWHNI